MSRKRNASIGIVFQGVTFLLALTTGVVLVPLYLKYLTREQYGAWLATGSVLQWIALIDPGIANILQERAANAMGKGNRDDVGVYFSAAFRITIKIALIYGCLALVFVCVTRPLLGIHAPWVNAELTPAIILSAIGSIAMLSVHNFNALGNALQNPLSTGIINSVSWMSSIVGCLILLPRGFGLSALGLMPVIQSFVALFLYGLTYREFVSFNAHNTELKLAESQILFVSKPTFLAKLASTIVSTTEAPILVRIVGAEQTAVFLVLKKVCDVGRLILERPVAAIAPQIAHLAGENDFGKSNRVLVATVRMWLWIAGLFCSVLLATYHNVIAIWVGESFWLGQSISLILILSALVVAAVNSLYVLAFATGNGHRASNLMLVYGVTTLCLAIPAASLGGVVGPSYAVAAVSLGTIALGFVPLLRQLLRDLSGSRWFIKEGLCVIVASGVTFGGLYFLKAHDVFHLVIKLTSIGCAYCVILVALSAQARVAAKKVISLTQIQLANMNAQPDVTR